MVVAPPVNLAPYAYLSKLIDMPKSTRRFHKRFKKLSKTAQLLDIRALQHISMQSDDNGEHEP